MHEFASSEEYIRSLLQQKITRRALLASIGFITACGSQLDRPEKAVIQYQSEEKGYSILHLPQGETQPQTGQLSFHTNPNILIPESDNPLVVIQTIDPIFAGELNVSMQPDGINILAKIADNPRLAKNVKRTRSVSGLYLPNKENIFAFSWEDWDIKTIRFNELIMDVSKIDGTKPPVQNSDPRSA